MLQFLKDIRSGNTSAKVSKTLTEALYGNFGDVINAEWSNKGDKFEAVFYKDNIENIAIFHAKGNLIEYKMYLSKEFLPEAIKHDMEKRGEIMNVVLINKGNNIIYEVLVRNEEFTRVLLLVNQIGVVLDENTL